jgi:tetratricopeptide (TPR) repeat protein
MSRPIPTSQAAKAKHLFAQGIACHQSGDLDKAKALYIQILGLMPSQPDALHMLGVAEFQNRNFAQAEQLIAKVCALQPSNDLAHFNHGNALRGSGKLEQAAVAFRKALKLRPAHLEALKNLGNVLKEQNRMAEAIECYDQLLAIAPDHAHTLYNKSIALLTEGRFAEGWDLYDFRLQCDTSDSRYLGHEIPRQAPDWDGSRPAKPLLVLPEQGLGDQIFYGAMLGDLQSAQIESFACLDARLLPLFRRSFPGIDFALPAEISGLDPALQLFGAQVQIGSLGRFFRRYAAGLARVSTPFLLADQAQTDSLRSRLQQDGKLICGLSWSSKNLETGTSKSLPLAGLLPVLQIPDVQFIDLQYGDTQAERHALAMQHGIDVQRLDDIDNKNDIDQLASLIMACDLVITVSNSTAHLAAALGKPVVILLAHHTPLWYWHIDGMRSPWYPSATLLRQPAPGDWIPTVRHAAELLADASKAS